MPRDMVRAPGHDRERSLGWLALAWLEALTVHGPGDVQGEPVCHGDEYSEFIADLYALDPAGRRLYDSAFLSRPKGCDKSGLAARLVLFEALGPCRFTGWAHGGEVYELAGFQHVYETGEPMGAPVLSPFVRILATEETQAGNTYDSVYYNLTEGPLARVPGVGTGLTRTFLPGGGQITPSTASSSSKDGGLETFLVLDESHLMTTPELKRMAATVRRNLVKRGAAAEPWSLETTTMFETGAGSVAEESYDLAARIAAGQVRRPRHLSDHRWADVEDLRDEGQLRAGLAESYGDALAWNDEDRMVDHGLDLRTHPADFRRYYFNAPTAAFDAWLAGYEWAAGLDERAVLEPGEVVTLGFDGSKGVEDDSDVADSTALVACRVGDMTLFPVATWEQPSGAAGKDWRVPVDQVLAAVEAVFARQHVVAFYADPAHWREEVADWERDHGAVLAVKATRDHPVEFWTSRDRVMVSALAAFRDALCDGGLRHDGTPWLNRHALNARRRPRRVGMLIGKSGRHSPDKIDGLMAAVLAYAAALAARAAGATAPPEPERVRSKRLVRF